MVNSILIERKKENKYLIKLLILFFVSFESYHNRRFALEMLLICNIEICVSPYGGSIFKNELIYAGTEQLNGH